MQEAKSIQNPLKLVHSDQERNKHLEQFPDSVQKFIKDYVRAFIKTGLNSQK